MFGRIKARFESMGTIKALNEAAERFALEDQQREPGAEHFLLAALALPDSTARLAFEAIGADADGSADAATAGLRAFFFFLTATSASAFCLIVSV